MIDFTPLSLTYIIRFCSSVDSKCAHILVKESVDDSFTVITQNHEDCYFNPIYCYKIIRIYLQDKEYILKKTKEGKSIYETGFLIKTFC